MKREGRRWPEMGELVAALFALMAVFGMLSFFVVLVAGIVDPARSNPAILTALLTFTGSSAAGFAATWRFIVTAAAQADSTVSGTSEPDAPTGDSSTVRHDRWRR
jgi:hypothetical protein